MHSSSFPSKIVKRIALFLPYVFYWDLNWLENCLEILNYINSFLLAKIEMKILIDFVI